MAEAHTPVNANALKRKRSSPQLSSPVTLPQNKLQKTNNLQINYLARHSAADLPLINKSDAIPSLLDVLSSYSSVLDRHESLASNLGARPLGPILIKRFERCFEAPPEIIASHSHSKDPSESLHVTWLEVIQFAQSHPGQFTLSTFSEGRRVCQFYYPQKQVRLQVSEDDYLFIKSGRCQDLIPPLPIWEDEEKEVGTCEILERQLKDLTNAADTVAARTRQLIHRLKSRRMAIMERRAGEKSGEGRSDVEHDSVDDVSPDEAVGRHSPGLGLSFTAVNGLPALTHMPHGVLESSAPVSVRSELLKHFSSLSQNQSSAENGRGQSVSAGSPTRPSAGSTNHFMQLIQDAEPAPAQRPQTTAESTSPQRCPEVSSNRSSEPATASSSAHNRAPSMHTPSLSGKHNFSRPLAPSQEVSQPFRLICQALMESLPRGARVMPPCDRCRRLKMDCLKNLTSCQGCTKKHARCHWKEVDRAEVEGLEGIVAKADRESYHEDEEDDEEDLAALEDLEALGREEDEPSLINHSEPQSALPHGDLFRGSLPIGDESADQLQHAVPTTEIALSAEHQETTSPKSQPLPPPLRPSSTFNIPGFTSVNSLPRALTAAPVVAPSDPEQNTAAIEQPQQPVSDATYSSLAQKTEDTLSRPLSPFSSLLNATPRPQTSPSTAAASVVGIQQHSQQYQHQPSAGVMENDISVAKSSIVPGPGSMADMSFAAAPNQVHGVSVGGWRAG